MIDTDRDDKMELEAFFDAARAAPEPAGEALMARVLGDGLAVQAAQAASPAGAVPDRVPEERRGRFAGLFAALGGWPAVAGLAAAAVAGVWIGFSPALGVGDAMTSAMSGALGVDGTTDAYLVDYATGYEFAFEEGDAG